MRNRFLVIIAVIVLVLGLCTGCGNNQVEEPPVDEALIDEPLVMSLEDLSPMQLEIFEKICEDTKEPLLSGEKSEAETWEEQEALLNTYIAKNVLPQNAVNLFEEWKEGTGYYYELAELMAVNKVKAESSLTESDTAQQEPQKTAVVPQQNNPQPSEKQQNTQAQDIQDKQTQSEAPAKKGTAVSAGGGPSTIVDISKHLGTIEQTFTRAVKLEAKIMAEEQGISYEEALHKIIEEAVEDTGRTYEEILKIISEN